jgi:hypothetical protein
MTITKLIGNEEKGENLVETAIENSVIKEILEGKAKQNYSQNYKNLKLDPCKKAEKIIKSIEDCVGFDEDTGLIRNKPEGIGDENQNYRIRLTRDSALLAVAYCALGKKRKYNNLMENIRKNIVIQKGIVMNIDKDSRSTRYACTMATLSVCLADYAGGNADMEKIDKSIIDIDNNVGRLNNGLRRPIWGADLAYTRDNILFSLLYELSHPQYTPDQHIFKIIKDEIGINEKTGLFNESTKSDRTCIGDNALMALLYLYRDEKIQGHRLYKKIYKDIIRWDCSPHHKNPELFIPFNDAKGPDDFTYDNISLALLDMAFTYSLTSHTPND